MLGAPRAAARYKVTLMGEPEVGKTSVIRRYVDHAFDEHYLKTLGTNVYKHLDDVTLRDGARMVVALTIWDVMGQKGSIQLLGEAYFNSSHGALAVFDVTRPETLGGLQKWIQAARRGQPRIPIVVLGNKCDLVDRRRVSDAQARDFCEPLALTYFPTSAKTGENIEAAFRMLAKRALRTFAGVEIAGSPLV